MIAAPGKATQQYCKWLRPRGLEGGIIQDRAIDIVCTRASNIGTSKSNYSDALLHTRFLSDLYGMGGGCTKKAGNNFPTRKKRGKIVPPVVKLRHAKVVSRWYPRKKPVACIRPGIASFGGYSPRKDSLEKNRQCGWRALLLL